MTNMRATLVVNSIESFDNSESLKMSAVRNEPIPENGKDEDNNYSLWSPQAKLEIFIANPEFRGKFKPGDKFILDFTKVEN